MILGDKKTLTDFEVYYRARTSIMLCHYHDSYL